MRSDRRHELQTNELSTQLEKVSEHVKQNATLLTAIVGGAIVVVVGGIWFVNQRASAQTAAWSKLSPGDTSDATPEDLISQYESVAREKVTPAITRSAWLMVGRTAMFELMKNRDANVAPDPEAREKMRKAAEEAFSAVVADPGNDFTALGRSLMGLGIIAEDRGEFDAAKEHYEKVLGNEKLKKTPIGEEARYRLDHLSDWDKMITFPEPEVPPMLAPTEGVFNPAGDAKPMKEVTPPPAATKSEPAAESPAAPAVDESADTPADEQPAADTSEGDAANEPDNNG